MKELYEKAMSDPTGEDAISYIDELFRQIRFFGIATNEINKNYILYQLQKATIAVRTSGGDDS